MVWYEILLLSLAGLLFVVAVWWVWRKASRLSHYSNLYGPDSDAFEAHFSNPSA